jgi:hypothetical protein
MDYRKLAKNNPAKSENIFEPIVKINVGMIEIDGPCDLATCKRFVGL